MYRFNFASTSLYHKAEKYFLEFQQENQLDLMDSTILFDEVHYKIQMNYNWVEMNNLFPSFLRIFLGKQNLLSKQGGEVGLDVTITDLDGNISLRYKQFLKKLKHNRDHVALNLKGSELAPPRLGEINDLLDFLSEDQNPGIIIAGEYYNFSPRRFLINNLTELKIRGCNVIVLEHFLSSQQDILDDWIAGNQKLMPRALEMYVKSLDMAWLMKAMAYGVDTDFEQSYQQSSLETLLYAAKENSMSVVALEDECSLYSLLNVDEVRKCDRAKIICTKAAAFCNNMGDTIRPIFMSSLGSVIDCDRVLSVNDTLGYKTISIYDDGSYFPDKSEELSAREADYFNREELCFSEHQLNRLSMPNQHHIFHLA